MSEIVFLKTRELKPMLQDAFIVVSMDVKVSSTRRVRIIMNVHIFRNVTTGFCRNDCVRNSSRECKRNSMVSPR